MCSILAVGITHITSSHEPLIDQIIENYMVHGDTDCRLNATVSAHYRVTVREIRI